MALGVQPEGRQGRHDRESDDGRGGQGDHDGSGHGLEHLPLDAFEGEDRHIDERDDGDAEEHRTGDLAGRGGKLGRALILRQGTAEGADPLLEPSQEVLHHHDGAIDDEPEVDRAQAHQVGAGLGGGHAREQEQEGQRDGQGDEQRGPPMAEQQEQHGDDDKRPLEQVGLDRADGGSDEIRAVVEHGQLHALRQVGADRGELLRRAARDLAGVLAGEHDGGADDGFVAVDGGRAHTGGVADRDAGDIAHGHGGAKTSRAQRDAGQVLGGADAGVGPDGKGLPAQRHNSAAGVLGIAAHGPEQFRHGHAGLGQLGEIRLHEHLPLMAAYDVDVRQPRCGAKGRTHPRVMQQAEFPQARGLVGRRLCFRRVTDGVIDDLAQASADRRHHGHGTRRQVAGGLTDALGHELAGAEDVRAVLEDQRDLGETDLGERTELHETRQAREFGLQWDGHAGLDLVSSKGGERGVDLHLRSRDVRHGVHRDAIGRPEAEGTEQQGARQHGAATADGPAGEGRDHFSVRRRSRRPP